LTRAALLVAVAGIDLLSGHSLEPQLMTAMFERETITPDRALTAHHQ
jgi:hypothetical protein